MTNFRTKLAVILVHSELNDDDIRSRDFKDDEVDTDPTDCEIVDRPLKKIKTSTSSSKDELLSQLLVISPSVDSPNTDLVESSQVLHFGHDSASFCTKVIDFVFLNISSQIYLPYDILGIFILFVLDLTKKLSIFWTLFRDRPGGCTY